MSVDWEFYIVHDEPPNLTSDEMMTDVTCWYLARPLDKPDATLAFVDMIQRELDA